MTNNPREEGPYYKLEKIEYTYMCIGGNNDDDSFDLRPRSYYKSKCGFYVHRRKIRRNKQHM